MQSLYKELAPYYDEIVRPSVNTKVETAFLVSVFKEHGVQTVLDIACGTGRHSFGLAENGFNVTGVDYSAELLRVAESKVNGDNPVFKQRDVRNLNLDRQFDVAICMWSTFGELPYNELLTELPQYLGQHALFIIDTHYFAEYPTGTSQKSFTTNLSDGRFLKTDIQDYFEGKRRMRGTITKIGDSVTNDYSEMDLMTEADMVDLVISHGFRHDASYYDYELQPKQPIVKRLQLVFIKV